MFGRGRVGLRRVGRAGRFAVGLLSRPGFLLGRRPSCGVSLLLGWSCFRQGRPVLLLRASLSLRPGLVHLRPDCLSLGAGRFHVLGGTRLLESAVRSSLRDARAILRDRRRGVEFSSSDRRAA